MIEIITTKHNRASLEAWHDNCLVATSEGALLAGIVNPVMIYATSLDAMKVKVVYKRPCGPNGEISPVTLYEHNSDMKYRAGAHPHAVALRFVRCDQLTGGLAPPRVRPCWAHKKKPRNAGLKL